MVLIQHPQTETNAQGQSTTIVWRAIRANKEDRVAKLEWAPGGGLGRAVIGKVRPSLQRTFHLTSFLRSPLITQNHVPMADLVRRDPRMPVRVLVLSRFHFHLTWGEQRTREYSMAPMVTNTDGDQVLPARILWWVSLEYDMRGMSDHIPPAPPVTRS